MVGSCPGQLSQHKIDNLAWNPDFLRQFLVLQLLRDGIQSFLTKYASYLASLE